MMMRSRSDAAVISREPSLPIATTATRPPGDLAVVDGESGFNPFEQRSDQSFGKSAIGAPRPERIEPAGEKVQSNQKHLFRREIARAIERLLVSPATER